jgi:NAD(P)-dependent dehydrogenase (short-subunit alcohol dehydrogenase family)
MESVLVTGTSTGIGHAIAVELASRGYTVFAGVRKQSDAETVGSAHANLRPVMLDVTDQNTIDAAIESVRHSGIPLRALVNNAGIAVGGPLEFLPLDELRKQFDVNVFGTIAMVQAAMPLLREAHGRIVSIGSIASRFGAPVLGPYCASKAALASLMDALRLEVAPFGVDVILFEFGAMKTPIWAKGRATRERLLARLPSQMQQTYGSLIEAAIHVTQRAERAGLSPAVVARAVARALEVSSPRARYVVGRAARVRAVVGALPHRLRDAIVRKALRIP